MATVEFRDAFYNWYAQYLKDRGLQFTKAGSKASFNSKHAIDPASGYWIDANYSGSKPIRWLVQVDPFTVPPTAKVPDAHRAERIGHSNTAQGDKAGIAVRLVPVIAQGNGQFAPKEDWELTLLFCFATSVPIGSAAETFDFHAADGALIYLGKPLPYIFSALLSMVPRADTAAIAGKTLSFGEVADALQSIIKSAPAGSSADKIPVFDLTSAAELTRLKTEITDAYNAVPQSSVISTNELAEDDGDEYQGDQSGTLVDVPENKDLIGIDPAVYRQINAALKSGKRHLMLYGPPGTGKTTLARHIAQTLSPDLWTLITGSADWSSQDIIGGYQPVGGGDVAFQPGVLLRAFDQPLIIDEMNRCDIDKVLGPLFTVLAGQHTTLPYKADIKDAASPQYVILAAPKTGAAKHEFAPKPLWRLVATINSIDKASLYQMSYALTRRFGWIYVDVPQEPIKFIAEYLQQIGAAEPTTPDTPCPLASIWSAVNEIRPIGPAPFIDIIQSVRTMIMGNSFFGAPSSEIRTAILDGMDMVLLPMLDGIVSQDAEKITNAVIGALGLNEAEQSRIRGRLRALAV